MTRDREKNRCGFTLLEVLVSVSILAFGVLAVGTMQVVSIQQNARADRVTEASVWARDRMERLMALTYSTTGTDADLDEGTYEDDSPPAGYAIDWEITDGCATTGCDTPQDTKLIEVTVAHDNLNENIVLMNIKSERP